MRDTSRRAYVTVEGEIEERDFSFQVFDAAHLAVDVGQVDVDDASFRHLAFVHVNHFLLWCSRVIHPLDCHVA